MDWDGSSGGGGRGGGNLEFGWDCECVNAGVCADHGDASDKRKRQTRAKRGQERREEVRLNVVGLVAGWNRSIDRSNRSAARAASLTPLLRRLAVQRFDLNDRWARNDLQWFGLVWIGCVHAKARWLTNANQSIECVVCTCRKRGGGRWAGASGRSLVGGGASSIFGLGWGANRKTQ